MEKRVYSGHIFEGSYKSTNPCIICGIWEDEAFTLPGKCGTPKYDNVNADWEEYVRQIIGFYEGNCNIQY